MFKTRFMPIVGAVALLMTANVFAADVAKPPVLPEPMMDGESIEPEVNIIQKDDRKIEEYRANGVLYMIKVQPTVGPAYYYIDSDGDGSLETKRHELSGHIVPNWVLFRW